MKIYPQKDLHKNIHSFIHNNQTLETTLMANNRQTVVYLYTEILLSITRMDNWHDMDKSQKYYTEWKKSDTKDYTFYDSTNRNSREEKL